MEKSHAILFLKTNMKKQNNSEVLLSGSIVALNNLVSELYESQNVISQVPSELTQYFLVELG